MIPSRANRSGIRGRPPGPRPTGGGGISGSSSAQSRLSTRRRGGEQTRVDMTRDDQSRSPLPARATRLEVLRPGLSTHLTVGGEAYGVISGHARAVQLGAGHAFRLSDEDRTPPMDVAASRGLLCEPNAVEDDGRLNIAAQVKDGRRTDRVVDNG